MSERVTSLTATTTTDRYGNTVEDWSTPTRRTFDALVAPATAEDYATQAQAGTSWDFRVYSTKPVTVTAVDRLLIRGLEYEVAGEPEVWRFMAGGNAGTVINARRRRG